MARIIGESGHGWLLEPQGYEDTCAIKAQGYVIGQFTGVDVPEGELRQIAIDEGWYAPGGTPQVHMGRLLNHFGIETTESAGVTSYDLTAELARGRKVIVSLDSGELTPEGEAFEDGRADHAVQVVGIDTTDPECARVIIHDPGVLDGAPVETSYPMEQFLDAWADSGQFMVSTVEPAPPSAMGMSEFDYDVGHVPRVLGLDYADFLDFEAAPSAWDMHWQSELEPTMRALDELDSSAHAFSDALSLDTSGDAASLLLDDVADARLVGLDEAEDLGDADALGSPDVDDPWQDVDDVSFKTLESDVEPAWDEGGFEGLDIDLA